MTVGFTGTSSGMTGRQKNTVLYLLRELQVTALHHGDCVGADAVAHRLAHQVGAARVIHPPLDDKLRAYCNGGCTVWAPRSYLARNRDIIREGVDGLIAAPKDFVAPKSLRGQGTWTTVGYARKAGRRIWLVFPDGTFREEEEHP